MGQKTDSLSDNKQKSGWSIGAVPAIVYDTDIGFKYGGLINFFNYGDGTIYPKYKHSIYLEWSRTTKGSGINQILFDSEYLIPKIRTSGELSFLTEKGLDFYGYNGYKALYDKNFTDDSPNNKDNYLSRMFYKQERKMLRLRADFNGRLFHDNFKWIGGVVHYNIKLDTIDVHKLNDGKPEEDKLPFINGGLYGYYKTWKVIPEKEYYGGASTLLKAGVVYDSRDNEPNPMKGIWSDILILCDPGIWGKDALSYSRFSFTHRQYFTLIKDRLSLAYRLGYQGKLHNRTPSYMLPIIYYYGRNVDRDGLGGAKNIRGILRNRVVGHDLAYGNFELRWKFLRTILFNQNIYIAFSSFTDMGAVTREYKLNLDDVPPSERFFFPDKNEKLHQSIGAGIHFALNENFVVAFDYGVALKSEDGENGLYLNMNWLY